MTPHVHTFGPQDGRPLVALHTLSGHGRRWRRIAGLLPGFRVLAPDLRGYGLSTFEPPWTLEQHAADVLDVIDRAGLERADIVGHSLGATIAVYLARMAPGRVNRLVLLDPGIGVPPALALRLARNAFRVPAFDSPEDAARTASPGEIADHLFLDGDGKWRWRYEPAQVVAMWSEVARPAITPPPGVRTLLVLATRDRPREFEYVAQWRAACGNDLAIAELDCGHQITLEQPERSAQLIRDFTLGHEPGQPAAVPA